MSHVHDHPTYSAAQPWAALLNSDTQHALLELARTPAGLQLVRGLGAQFNVPPALMVLFDTWVTGSKHATGDDANDDISDAEFSASENSNAHEAEDKRYRQALERELSELRNLNENLAAALGACAECWGADDTCPECEGQGGAGSERPDPELFNALVAPAVVRVNTNRVRRLRLISDSFTADSRG